MELDSRYPRPNPELKSADEFIEGVHAGKAECSILEYLYPGSNNFDSLKDSDDLFASSADQTDIKIGEMVANRTVDWLVDIIKNKQ